MSLKLADARLELWRVIQTAVSSIFFPRRAPLTSWRASGFRTPLQPNGWRGCSPKMAVCRANISWQIPARKLRHHADLVKAQFPKERTAPPIQGRTPQLGRVIALLIATRDRLQNSVSLGNAQFGFSLAALRAYLAKIERVGGVAFIASSFPKPRIRSSPTKCCPCSSPDGTRGWAFLCV